MTIQLPSLIFFLTILSLTIVDAKRLNTIITPFSVAAWPFVIISLSVNFMLGALKFPPVTIRAHFFILLNLIIIWLVGFIVSHFLKTEHISDSVSDIYDIFKPFVKYQYVLMIISVVSIIIVLFRVYDLIRQYGGWWFFGDKRYEQMIIVGPAAHVVQLAKACFLLLFFIYKHSNRKIWIIFTFLGLGIAIASIQVKYHLIWLLIIAFLYLNLPRSPSKQLKGIARIGLLVLVVMNIFWISLTFAWGTFSIQSKGIWNYLVNNSINYFVAGPILLDRWLDLGNIKPDWTMLIVFKNFFNVIMGDPSRIHFVPYVSHGFFQTAPGLFSNVGTSLGVYFMIGGYPFTIFMTTLISFFSYFIYFLSFRTKNPILLYLNFIFLTIGVMTFYGQYFTTVPLYEMSAIYIVFILIFQVLNSVKVKGYSKYMRKFNS